MIDFHHTTSGLVSYATSPSAHVSAFMATTCVAGCRDVQWEDSGGKFLGSSHFGKWAGNFWTSAIPEFQEFPGSWVFPADGTHLHNRSSTRCRSTRAVLTDSSVQNAIAKVVKSAETYAATHWMIYCTRKVAKTTPRPAQVSWSHQGSLCRVSLVGDSPTRASSISYDSIMVLWSVDGATLVSRSIVPALPT